MLTHLSTTRDAHGWLTAECELEAGLVLDPATLDRLDPDGQLVDPVLVTARVAVDDSTGGIEIARDLTATWAGLPLVPTPRELAAIEREVREAVATQYEVTEVVRGNHVIGWWPDVTVRRVA